MTNRTRLCHFAVTTASGTSAECYDPAMERVIAGVLLLVAAACQSTPPQVAVYRVGCHHDVESHDHLAWRAESERLAAWLSIADNRAAVQAEPAAIARFHDLPAEAGGPRSTMVRWFPHLVRAGADGTTWQVPYGRINSIAVPAYDLTSLRSGPKNRTDTLLEYVPLAASKWSGSLAKLTADWQALDASGNVERLAMAEELGWAVLVVDGYARLLPSDGHRPWRIAESLAAADRQFEAELRLHRQTIDGSLAPRRFLGFEQLRGFDGSEGLRLAPERVRKLDGARVVMVGRVLPIDEVTAAKRFLLFESPFGDDWGHACGYEDVVEVVCNEGVDPLGQPVRVAGTLRVRERREGEMLMGIYELVADQVTEL